jgi:peptidoglycan/xylan/chitin deacetylase (PgdA/CDA1 family)
VAPLLLTVPGTPGVPVPEARAATRCPSGYVSLTFDDGPSTTSTPRLLRILRERRVPATFFQVGRRVAAAPRVARRVERSGHLVANHSWAHQDMRTQTFSEVVTTLRRTRSAQVAAGTHPGPLMRPPYGALDAVARDAIASAGYRPVLWTIDPRDWTDVSASTIAGRILAGLRPHARNVVLQHDGVRNSPASVSAVPRVVRRARARGDCFVALDDGGNPGFPWPTASVSVGSTEVREGSDLRATVRLHRPTARATYVTVRLEDIGTTAGEDYRGARKRIRFPAGSMSRTVSWRMLRDGKDEPRERVAVVLRKPRHLRIGTGRREVVVLDAS